MRNPERPVPPPIIAIVIENVSEKHSMIIREIGKDKKFILLKGEKREFKVPYDSLMIGYQESTNHDPA